jgi:hypothetical protein
LKKEKEKEAKEEEEKEEVGMLFDELVSMNKGVGPNLFKNILPT